MKRIKTLAKNLVQYSCEVKRGIRFISTTLGKDTKDLAADQGSVCGRGSSLRS